MKDAKEFTLSGLDILINEIGKENITKEGALKLLKKLRATVNTYLVNKPEFFEEDIDKEEIPDLFGDKTIEGGVDNETQPKCESCNV